jgi:hypothetical protein
VGAFGEKLRKQREQRGIALDAISSTTKISTRMLRALEDERFDQLPGGVFNKGFVRAYARQVGLDEEEAVTDYLAALRESQIQQQSILPEFRAPAGKSSATPAPEPRQESRLSYDLPNHDLPAINGSHNLHKNQDMPPSPASPPHAPAANPSAGRFRLKYPAGSPAQPAADSSSQIPWGKLAVALLLVTLVLAFWNSRRHAAPTAAAQPSPAPASTPVSAPASAPTRPPDSAGSLQVGPSSQSGTLSAGTLSPGTISAGARPPNPNTAMPTLPGVPVPANSRAAASPPAIATPSTSGVVNKSVANPPAPLANLPLATNTAPANPSATFTLLIRAEKTTWVSIVADGKPVAEETLIAPAHTSVRATHEIVVKAGNAAGVSFLLNSKEIPAQGNEAEVRTYIFDPTGVRVLPPAQLPTTNR